jgi:ComEC/Rec2-related protein
VKNQTLPLTPSLDRAGEKEVPLVKAMPAGRQGGFRGIEILQWLVVILGCILIYRVVNRDSVIGYIFQSLPSKEAGLLAGIVLGDKTGMDKAFYNSLVNSGVLHLVVVSGSNVMLVTKLVIDGLAGWLGRKKSIVMGLILAWGYVALVGWQIPIIRAIFLVTIYYWGQLLGRKYDIVKAFGVTVGLMILVDWRMLGELSFWLTMMAFVGVMTKPIQNLPPAPPLKKEGRKMRGLGRACRQAGGDFNVGGLVKNLLEEIKASIWISLWVMPILAMSIGKISLVGPITTVLMMVVAQWTTLGGLIGVVVGQYCDILGKIILLMTYPLLKYGVIVVEMLGRFSWLNWGVKINLITAIGMYLILGGYWRKTNDKN